MALSIKERKVRHQKRKEGVAERLPVKGVFELVSLDFAAQFISEQINLPGEVLWRTHDKVKKVIRYAKENEKLPFDSNEQIVFGVLMTWAMAKKKWHTALQGMPSLIAASVKTAGPINSARVNANTIPPTHIECQIQIDMLQKTIRKLAEENERLKAGLDSLRTLEETDKDTRAKKSAAGKKAKGIKKGR